MHQLTLAEIARGLADKAFSAEELTRTLLARIQQLDPQINSFISVTEDLALDQARAADARRAQRGNVDPVATAHAFIGAECAGIGRVNSHFVLPCSFCRDGVMARAALCSTAGARAPIPFRRLIPVSDLAAPLSAPHPKLARGN